MFTAIIFVNIFMISLRTEEMINEISVCFIKNNETNETAIF